MISVIFCLHLLFDGRLVVGTPGNSDHDSDWDRLRFQVQEANPDLQDSLDVAATLESMGWTDRQVEESFGYSNLFDAGEEMYASIRRQVTQKPLPIKITIGRKALFLSVVRDIGHGVTFTLPMIISVAAMITLHISFSSYLKFSVPDATAIALATFFSFLTTGGFSQAMTNIYYVLTGMQKVPEIEATVFLVMRWSMAVTLVFCAAITIGDFIFPIMPESLIMLAVLYTILLSLLWLSFAGLYILRREYFLTIITALAIFIAYELHKRGASVQLAQSVAIIVASLSAVLTSLVIFRRRTRGVDPLKGVFATRLAQLAHGSGIYFAYGLLYFVYIYADRLVAWSSQTTYLPYNIWFRGQYELGMDWSLVALFVPLTLAEVLISAVMRRISNLEHKYGLRDDAGLYQRVRRTYLLMLSIFVALSVFGGIATHVAVNFLAPLPLFHLSVPVEGVEPFVFFWSSLAYVLFCVAIFNVLLLFSLSHPRPALRTLGLGIVVDLAVGLLAAQIFGGYQYAVFGLVAGSIFVALYSTQTVMMMLPRLDYFLYRLT